MPLVEIKNLNALTDNKSFFETKKNSMKSLSEC